jgi:hypothetical protein
MMQTVRFVGLALLGVVAAATPRPLVVGVLENNSCSRSHELVVRPLFAKVGGRWVAIDSQKIFDATTAPGMSWTIAFDGTSLGAIRSAGQKEDVAQKEYGWDVVRSGMLNPAPGQTLPTKPNRAHRFDTTCEEAPNRPLVLVTQPNVADPEAWKPITPTVGMRDSLFAPFRALVDSVWICPNGEDKPGRLLNYRARDLVIDAAYRNNTDRVIVGVQINHRYISCGAPAFDEWDTHWYLLGDKPTFLGSSLALVDAGDYDSNGKSELIFAYSAGEALGGYTMFADDFRTRVDVRWSYH